MLCKVYFYTEIRLINLRYAHTILVIIRTPQTSRNKRVKVQSFTKSGRYLIEKKLFFCRFDNYWLSRKLERKIFLFVFLLVLKITS
jgi:hypothetical protein